MLDVFQGNFQSFVVNFRISGSVGPFWIGLKYEDLGLDMGHQMTWEDGSIPQYSKFVDIPDSMFSKSCVYQESNAAASWANSVCGDMNEFICEAPKGLKRFYCM